jgi:hypothetical protein
VWRLVADGTGRARYLNGKSGLCLSPAGGATGINVTVVLERCDADLSRLWRAALV